MAYLLRTINSVFKVGSFVFGLKEKTIWVTTFFCNSFDCYDCMVYNDKLFVSSYSNNCVFIYSLSDGGLIDTITGLGSAIGLALDLPNNRFFVSSYSGNTVYSIDLTTLTKTATITGLASPQGVAVDNVNSRLYVLNSSTGVLTVFNLLTLEVITNIDGFSGCFGVCVDIENGRIFISYSSGIGVIDIVDFSSLGVVSGTVGSQSMVIDLDNNRLLSANYPTGKTSVISLTTLAITGKYGYVQGSIGISKDINGDFYVCGNVLGQIIKLAEI